MPLAPLSPSNTPRYFVDYKANGRNHTVMFRYATPVNGPPPATPYIARVASVFDDLKTWLPSDFAILGARYAVAGSDVTLPATAPAPAGPFAGALNQGEAPAFVTFVGRSAAGRKWRLSFLGVVISPAEGGATATDYRMTTAENTVIATVRTNLDGWTDIVAIDGEQVSLHPYANLGYNAHWQKALRG